MPDNLLDGYIKAHPRQSLQFLIVAIFLAWQSVACVLAIILYILLHKLMRLQWAILLGVGLVFASIIIFIDLYPAGFKAYCLHGLKLNFSLWHAIFYSERKQILVNLATKNSGYFFGTPLLIAGLLATTQLIKDNPHQKVLNDLQKGNFDKEKELAPKKIEALLKKINSETIDGTCLGVSLHTGERITIPDQFLNQILLVLGTTGSGKTITLRHFQQRAMLKGYPLIIVDGKPTEEHVRFLESMSERYQKKLYTFNCGKYDHYNPLAVGGFTELKDKIISLKDEWESEYYRSIAEDHLQTAFNILLQANVPLDLKIITNCLSHDELLDVARATEDEVLLKRAANLSKYEQKDITGLQAHLNLIINSELGKYFTINERSFSLPKVIEEDAIVYFALPALRFPSFAKVLGKLIINDLKATIDRSTVTGQRIFMLFDEFSVFAGEQVLNLVNMGRGKGVHAIFGTQGVADLAVIGQDFKEQVLNCVNSIVCHRLNDQTSAETVAAWIGTKDVFTVTGKFDQSSSKHLGSVRVNKEFLVHPERIKQELKVGEAFYSSKIDKNKFEKIKVNFIE